MTLEVPLYVVQTWACHAGGTEEGGGKALAVLNHRPYRIKSKRLSDNWWARWTSLMLLFTVAYYGNRRMDK